MNPAASRFDLLTDDSGYTLSSADFAFLSLSELSVQDCLEEVSPLGMQREHFEEFLRSLLQALWREGVQDADVRLQGSSASFYSGRHKAMPGTPEEAAAVFTSERGELPNYSELTSIWAALTAQWPDGSRPRRRPFDSLHVLGISTEKSDYDVQISSDQLFEKISDSTRFAGFLSEKFVVENSHYGFLRKEISEKDFLYIAHWIARWEPILDRPVNVAIFRSSGPPKNSPASDEDDEPISSHLRDEDWILHRGPITGEHIYPDLISAASDSPDSASKPEPQND